MPKPKKPIRPDKEILSQADFLQQHYPDVLEYEAKKSEVLDQKAPLVGNKYSFTRHVISKLFTELKRYGEPMLGENENINIFNLVCRLNHQEARLRSSGGNQNGIIQYRPLLYQRIAGRVELAIYLILVAEGYTFGNDLEELVRGKGDFLTSDRRKYIKAHLNVCRKQGLKGFALEQYILTNVFKDLLVDETQNENKRNEKAQKEAQRQATQQQSEPLTLLPVAPARAEVREPQSSRDNARKTLNLLRFHIKYYSLDLQYTQLLAKYIENYIEELVAASPNHPESTRLNEVNRLKTLAQTAVIAESTTVGNWTALNYELDRIATSIRRDYDDNIAKMRHRSFLYFIDADIDDYVDKHFTTLDQQPLNAKDDKRDTLKEVVKAKIKTVGVTETNWPKLSLRLKYLISCFKCDGGGTVHNKKQFDDLLQDIRSMKIDPSAQLNHDEVRFERALHSDANTKPKVFHFTAPTDLINYGKSLTLANQNYHSVIGELNALKADRYNLNLSLTEKISRMNTRCDAQLKFVSFLQNGIKLLDVAVNERRTNTIFYWPFTPPKAMEEVRQATRAALETALQKYVNNPRQLPEEALERTVTNNCLRLRNLKGNDWWSGLFGPTRQLWKALDSMSSEIKALQEEWSKAQAKTGIMESQSYINLRAPSPAN